MPFAAALSTAADTETAVAEACTAAWTGVGSEPPDLAVVFFSPHHVGDAELIARQVCEAVGTEAVVGCLGESVVGTGREVEREPAVSLWLARFGPGVEVETFHLTPDRAPDGLTLFGWPDGLVTADPGRAVLLTLADPYTFPLTELFFPRLHDDYPGLAAVGGMSSGADGPGQTALIRGREAVYSGAVGALLHGRVGWRTVVSQGCRPIGRPLVVTKGRDNVIQELGGRNPLEVLQEVYDALPAGDQELFRRGLHVGLVMSEYREAFGRGDFLIRNLYGVDREAGALVVTDRVRAGQTVQFQLRDADTADDDLRELLRADKAKHGPAGGALLFTCNGRGRRLFAAPDHDARVVAEEVGPVPTAGFFAAGELGPVGGTNYIHGFTASVVLFD
ncbi:MAG: FIST C-terminal domain-containing protein [Gemmataceae bacterium]